MHEFLVLHYLATDSAQGWEEFLSQWKLDANYLAESHADERQMSRCSLLSKNAASIVGYEHDIAC